MNMNSSPIVLTGKQTGLPRKLILRSNTTSPSDDILLTAAVRDLHLHHPKQFLTDIRTPWPQLWENNPHISELEEGKQGVEIINYYGVTNQNSANTTAHALHIAVGFLNKSLNLNFKLSAVKGDVYLSNEEKIWDSQVAEVVGQEIPFWVFISGGTYDVTTKWWEPRRFQEVVDYFKEKIQFVQVGSRADFHPELKAGILDLRGKTDLRQLIRLIYHTQGVLCPTTLLMHLAAAVEVKERDFKTRPCVVLAGGREPASWKAYPDHQFIHPNGTLLCSNNGSGCWKSRVVALRDGSQHDRLDNICVDVNNKLPRCMEIITSAEVIRRIKTYFDGSLLQYLSPTQTRMAKQAILFAKRKNCTHGNLEAQMFKRASEKFIQNIPKYPDRFHGRGIVICAGGEKYFTCAWVCIRMLRRFGCSLPIQLWHLDQKEIDEQMKSMVAPYNVECVNAADVRKNYPARRLYGWELKPYAIIHSPFQEILFLDADNVPVVNPEFLFKTPEFKKTGAIFWPDFGRLKSSRSIWDICGIPYRDEPEFESGQIVVNKAKCWAALCLTMWYNEHSDFYYKHIHGDKETFHMAFRKFEQPFATPSKPVQAIYATLCQHDFKGRRIFQHRNGDKWTLSGENKTIVNFRLEEECKNYLKELDHLWHGSKLKVSSLLPTALSTELKKVVKCLIRKPYNYHRIGFDNRTMRFLSSGKIGEGSGKCEVFWNIRQKGNSVFLSIYSDESLTCKLELQRNGIWKGKWIKYEKMPVELTPIDPPKLFKAFKTRSTVKSINHKEPILFRAPLTGYTGYGLHATQIVTDLQRMGYQFNIRAVTIEETFAPIPDNVRHNIVSEEPASKWELLLHPPGIPPTSNKRRAYFTMWESSRLQRHAVETLNQAECVIVPTQWNASCFSASGVKKPIRIVPLGINTQVFHYVPMKINGLCIFGTAGRFESGGHRKGINEIIETFRKAFPNEKDVRLKVKVFPDCEVKRITDSRVEIKRKYMTEGELAQWFSEINCFVSAARGEGWGLMQHQALAVGRPIISVKYGGVAEFFNSELGYPINFTLVEADGLYAQSGIWAQPDWEHMIELMRQVYLDQIEACERGKRGAKSVSKYTWHNSNVLLVKTLKEAGFLL